VGRKALLQGVLVLFLIAFPGLAQLNVLPEQNSIPGENTCFRLERQSITGGAELITLFGKLQDPASSAERLDVPIVSILRDTLGDSDPENHRLRYVWVLTSTRPTPVQRLASAFSFLCFRTGTKHHENRLPAPVLDLASPGKTVLPTLLGKGLQATELDPLGVMVRTSSRSYFGNSSDYRKLHLYQALGALDGLERSDEGRDILPDSQLHEIYSRLRLTDHTFGGLVRKEKLSGYYDKESSRREQMLGHNWELLRQRAELAGLYFEPLALPDSPPTEALLWIAREDLEQRGSQRYDRQFLNIANPWTDERLAHWTGYTQVRYLDADRRAVSPDTPGARPVEMIPLALYSLDHPRAPLLLADIRNSFKPKRGELVRHGATTLVTGVFGFTRFGNWPFFVGDSALSFVRARHGAAMNRSARLEAYSDARQFLAVDSSLDPKLRTELLHRLDHLALNPLENGLSTEATVANEQYAALLQDAESSKGLAAKLERDRRKELDTYTRSGAWRFLARVGRVFTRGPHVDPENPDPRMRAELAAYRRASRQMRFLEEVLASGPSPEVSWDASAIRQSIEDLSSGTHANQRAPRLIAQVFTASGDPEVRFACLRALRRLDLEVAHNELWRLSQDPSTEESWRAICMLYFKGVTSTGQVAALGGGQ
jgi:hypothetical protein